jgi:hypothetical protein
MAAHKKSNKITIICMTSGFHPSANEVCTLLGCYAALIGNLLPTFWNSPVFCPISMVKHDLEYGTNGT